jgi:phospholipase/carboxylesterase
MRATRLDLAGLTSIVVGPTDATVTCVLLHGFGAPGDDLVSLAGAIDAPARFVFPAAPLELSGMYGGARAWWLLDLAKLEEELRRGTPRDRRAEAPEGLPAARESVTRLLEAVQARFSVPDERLVIGGFSQGAMVSLDVALHRARRIGGLVGMSGTLLAEDEWGPRMPHLAGVPVLMSHGRTDALLPYHLAELLRDKLTTAGALVEWLPFVGGHEIPLGVLEALSRFLRERVG